MKVKVKICGIRTSDTAEAATRAGADFLGFNFVPSSKRYIDPRVVLKIINSIENRVKTVGVFQDAKIAEVKRIASYLKLDFVQLHGTEDNDYMTTVGFPIIKSLTTDSQPDKIKADYLLLDRPKRGKGKIVNLEKATKLATNFPLFIAGGLTPDNVAYVVRKVRPFAVDVASGIETDGIHNIQKIKKFIQNAKGVNI